MTRRTARTRSTSSPSPPPSLSLSRRKRARDLLGAARHVVGVAEPDRPRRRRPGARQAEQPPDGHAEKLPLQVVQGGVERGLRRVLAAHLPQPRADLLEREGVVAEERGVLLHERVRRLRGLPVALDRRPLAPSDLAAVANLDVDDVGPVGRLARDDERLGETEADDGRFDQHAERLLRRRDPDHVGQHVRLR